MSSYVQNLTQIVFCPKYRKPCLIKTARPRLFGYMMGIIENMKCKPYVINGIEDHLHIVVRIHQTVPLATLVKEVKISSHKLIDQELLFPEFDRWQIGYGAFTYSRDSFRNVVRYVENQEQHHYGVDFKTEFVGLLEEHDIPYDERYLFE